MKRNGKSNKSLERKKKGHLEEKNLKEERLEKKKTEKCWLKEKKKTEVLRESDSQRALEKGRNREWTSPESRRNLDFFLVVVA